MKVLRESYAVFFRVQYFLFLNTSTRISRKLFLELATVLSELTFRKQMVSMCYSMFLYVVIQFFKISFLRKNDFSAILFR